MLLYNSVPEVVFDCYAKAKVDSSSLNLILSLGSLGSIVMTPVMIFFDNYFNSIRALTLIGLLMLNTQNLLRMIPHWSDKAMEHAVVFMTLSEVFNGFSMPFSYGLPSRVTSAWFPSNERVVITSVCSLVNPLGGAMSFLIVPLVASNPDNFVIVLYVLL